MGWRVNFWPDSLNNFLEFLQIGFLLYVYMCVWDRIMEITCHGRESLAHLLMWKNFIPTSWGWENSKIFLQKFPLLLLSPFLTHTSLSHTSFSPTPHQRCCWLTPADGEQKLLLPPPSCHPVCGEGRRGRAVGTQISWWKAPSRESNPLFVTCALAAVWSAIISLKV